MGLASVEALDDHRATFIKQREPVMPLAQTCRRSALLMLAAMPLALASSHAGATEIYVVGAGAIEEPFEQLSDAFEKQTGNKVHSIFGPVGGMQAKLKGGEKADVILLSAAAMDALDKAGALVAGTRADVGRATVGIAVKSGATQPDISTPDALKKALLSARTIGYTNPAAGGTAGIYLNGLLDRLGIADEVKKKAVLQSSGSAVAAAVANDAAEIGISFTSELMPNKQVKVVGFMPQPIGLVVTYAGAVASASKEADAARALINYVTTPAARDHFKAAGL
jgi:molybdate transport system substrate-binding protein